MMRAVRSEPADVPGQIGSPIEAYLRGLYERCRDLQGGDVATYIPELAKADPNWFGIAIATTDGHQYEIGDSRQLFTIQSISKPFVYGLGLEDRGVDAVLAKIGVEPTGDAFNSISLEPGTGRPLNPMINAGAITATSLIAGHSYDDKRDRLLAVLSTYAGRPLTFDTAVYASESATGHRNRAIGHMLRNFDILTDDPDPVLDLYFRQCAVAVDCRDLSMMAATLANGGVNPLTGERAVREALVDRILSAMTTCGMYDYAGEWVYWVGMPAKSGVAGGVLAVLPGQVGVGVFSPRLDARGNSVRGVAVCKALSTDFNLHFLRVPRSAQAVVRARHTVADLSSKRLRDARERQVLDRVGGRARIYDLQGDLGFAALEAVVRELVAVSPALDIAVLDFKRVARVDDCVAPMLVQLVVELATNGKPLLFVNLRQHAKFLRRLEEGLAAADHPTRLLSFADLDAALEWCENRLIADHCPELAIDRTVPLAEHQLCDGLSADALARLERLLEPHHFAPGEPIIRQGDPADSLYLLMRGRVDVTLALSNGQIKRLSTLSAGMVFGELAIIDRGRRTADVSAGSAVECRVLSAAAFDRLGDTQPAIKSTILANLLRQASRTVSRLNREVSALAE